MKSTRAPIKILHIFGRMNRGGAEMRTLDLMRNIDRAAFQMNFCSLSGQEGDLDAQIRELGGEVYPCQLGVGFPRRFRQLLRVQHFDVVHSHIHHTSGYILRIAASEKIPGRIAHFRGTNDGRSNSLRRRLQRKLLCRWIDRYATNILAVSEGAMNYGWKSQWSTESRCKVIYNGVDTKAFSMRPEPQAVRQEFGIPADARLYIHVGRIEYMKNHERLLSIFRNILQEEPQSRLLLVGRGGAAEQHVHNCIKQQGLSDRVILAGLRFDVARLLMASDLLIFPSLHEGLPGVVLEACAAGIPVLGSDIPGINEISSYIPQTFCLSLDKSDAEWGQVARETAAAFASPEARGDIVRAFASSVFTIQECVDAHSTVWRGAIQV